MEEGKGRCNRKRKIKLERVRLIKYISIKYFLSLSPLEQSINRAIT